MVSKKGICGSTVVASSETSSSLLCSILLYGSVSFSRCTLTHSLTSSDDGTCYSCWTFYGWEKRWDERWDHIRQKEYILVRMYTTHNRYFRKFFHTRLGHRTYHWGRHTFVISYTTKSHRYQNSFHTRLSRTNHYPEHHTFVFLDTTYSRYYRYPFHNWLSSTNHHPGRHMFVLLHTTKSHYNLHIHNWLSRTHRL